MKLHVKLIRSTIKRVEKQKRIVAALGIRKMNQVKIHDDNPVIRGMIYKVRHLVEVIEVPCEVAEINKDSKPKNSEKPKKTVKATKQAEPTITVEAVEPTIAVENETTEPELETTAVSPKRGRKKADLSETSPAPTETVESNVEEKE
jgi:large subunit ribosomal protein L30